MTTNPPSVKNLEQTHPWLKPLTEAYAYLDMIIKRELGSRNRKTACGPGCYACCLQPIPVTVAEIAGLRLFLRSDLAPGVFGAPLPAEESAFRCPFLQNGTCSVYALRPFACRRFIVFSKPCALDEDPTVTRPEDMHHSSQGALLHALRLTLPLYRRFGIEAPDNAEREFFTRYTTLIQHTNWIASGASPPLQEESGL